MLCILVCIFIFEVCVFVGVGEFVRMNFLRLFGKLGLFSFRIISNLSSLSNMSVLNDEFLSIMSICRSISNLSSVRFVEECGFFIYVLIFDKLFVWEKKFYLEVKVCFVFSLVVYFFGGFWMIFGIVLVINCVIDFDMECLGVL